MKKTIGTYTIKMNANTNLITITDNGEMIYGNVATAADSGSAFNSVCDRVQAKVDADHKYQYLTQS